MFGSAVARSAGDQTSFHSSHCIKNHSVKALSRISKLSAAAALDSGSSADLFIMVEPLSARRLSCFEDIRHTAKCCAPFFFLKAPFEALKRQMKLHKNWSKTSFE